MLDAIHDVAVFLAQHLVVWLCFTLGLGLRPGELRANARREVFWRAIAVALLGVPIVTILVVIALPLDPLVESVLLLSAIAPGAPMLANKVRKTGGDVVLSVALSVALTLLAVALLPLALPLIGAVSGEDYRAHPLALARSVALPVFVALLAGLALRRWLPSAAERIAPWAGRLFKLSLAIVLPVLLVVGGRTLLAAHPIALVAGLLVPLLAAALGHLLGGRDVRERKTLAIVAAFGNPAIALAVAAATYGDRRALPVMAAVLILRAAVMALYGAAARSIRSRPSSPTRSAAARR
jgi:BASS family bile acid:Na+ symporter